MSDSCSKRAVHLLTPVGLAAALILSACGGGTSSDAGTPPQADAGLTADAGSPVTSDAGTDAGQVAAGSDAGEPDAGADAGTPDAGADAGQATSDAGMSSTGSDAGSATDGGASDAGASDAGCHIDLDCQANAATPYCDVLGHICVSCVSNANCAAEPDAGLDDICIITSGKGICTNALAAGTCLIGDGGARDCASVTPDQPICDPSSGVCVQCLTASDCPGTAYVCNGGGCAEACSGDTTSCSSTCRDLKSDPNHCGTCDNACGTSSVCDAGSCEACASVLPDAGGPGTVAACGNTCTNIDLDPLNCGACGKVCPVGDICSDGTCVSCTAVFDAGPSGYAANCGTTCTNLESDPDNCGNCGVRCGAGTSCIVGTCETSCASDSDCANVNGAPYCDLIGKVCVACTTGSQCTNVAALGEGDAVCVLEQNGPAAGAYCNIANAYGVSCVDGGAGNFCPGFPDQPICNPASGNCVQCLSGTDCPAGDSCSAGACVTACPAGTTLCSDGNCADFNTDPQHCGTCATACQVDAGQACSDGMCELSCPAGTTACDGSCIPTDSDPNNCGGCGSACYGALCVSGNCQQCPNAANGDQQDSCNNVCTDILSDPSNCGFCGTVCPAGQVCDQALCAPACTKSTDCSGTPTPYCDTDAGACVYGDVFCTSQQISAHDTIYSAPIILPNQAAGLNLAGMLPDGGVTWEGLTLNEAEQADCNGQSTPDIFGNGADWSMDWQDSIVISFNQATKRVLYLGIGPGLLGGRSYTGTLKIGDSQAQIVIPVDGTSLITCNGPQCPTMVDGAFALDWVDASNGDPDAIAPFDAIYRAAMATFLPDFSQEAWTAGVNCVATGACQIGTFPAGAYGYFYIPALGWQIWANPYTVPASANAINRMDFSPVGLEDTATP